MMPTWRIILVSVRDVFSIIVLALLTIILAWSIFTGARILDALQNTGENQIPSQFDYPTVDPGVSPNWDRQACESIPAPPPECDQYVGD